MYRKLKATSAIFKATATGLLMAVSMFWFIQEVFASATLAETYPTPVGALKLNCPWECGETYWFKQGYYAIPEMCYQAHVFINDIEKDIEPSVYGSNSVYGAGSNVAWDGLWNWDRYQITTGIGWTGWWVGLSNYCTSLGYWRESTADSIKNGATTVLTFTLNPEVIAAEEGQEALNSSTYDANLTYQDEFTIELTGVLLGSGTESTLTTPTFNSPFIYTNLPDGKYWISVRSKLGLYQQVNPSFTSGSAWQVEVADSEVKVGGEEADHLFYELAVDDITLSRGGKNFSTREEFVSYLRDSDFFDKLGFNDIEKSNSLGYLLPKLPESPNYYLTVLDDDSIKSISQLQVEPAPEELLRKYYVVYPTKAPVRVSGGLQFPALLTGGDSIVKEYGEIIVNSNMYVLWK